MPDASGLTELVSEHKLPLGRWIASLVQALTGGAQGFFDAVSNGLGGALDRLTTGLEATPPLLFVALAALLALWLQRSWRLAVFVAAALLLVVNLGLWRETMQTLSLVLSATLACIALGVPLGILAARRPAFFAVLRPVLDLMQTVPTFVYLIPTLVLFGLGAVPGLISTVIFALPAPIRLTHLGLTSVPRPLREAGEAFGATGWQLFAKVELPHALPTILAGITQCIMLSLSMVVIAALVGADGLGKPVVRALNTVNIGMGFEAGLAIVILAVVLDRLCKPPASRRKVRLPS